MIDFVGYPLKTALEEINNEHKVVYIKKIYGTNKKFNKLSNPYIIRQDIVDNDVVFFVCYY